MEIQTIFDSIKNKLSLLLEHEVELPVYIAVTDNNYEANFYFQKKYCLYVNKHTNKLCRRYFIELNVVLYSNNGTHTLEHMIPTTCGDDREVLNFLNYVKNVQINFSQ